MQIVTERHRNAEEILKLLPEGFGVQLINDNIVMSPAPKDIHQKISGKLHSRLLIFVEENDLGETRDAPSDVFLNDINIYQPDIYFVSKERLHLFAEDGFYGAPDLVVEIISPGSEAMDKGMKKDVYESAGVKEYWLIDPKTKGATGFENTASGFVQFIEEKGKLSSKLLNTVLIF